MNSNIKKILRIVSGVVIVYLMMAGGLYVMIHKITIPVYVPPGSTALQVTAILRKEGLIISRSFFMAYLKLINGINKIKAGHYRFSSRALMPAIAHALVKGKTVMTKLTIPEGLTMRQTAVLLASKGFGRKDVYEELFNKDQLEGYLLPETYIISPDLTEKQIVDILRAQFDRTFTDAWIARAQELILTKHEIVILASIIEKEAKAEHERPVISAVFHNRLNSNKYLESCATIQYALGGWKKRLLLKDLQIDSQYNTYKHFGLPPGPICSPGRKSLEAALYPADSDALFFISNGDGTHSFYTRYRDHLKGKKEYKKMIREYRKRKKGKPYK